MASSHTLRIPYGRDWIPVSTRPSCPHCSSRRTVGEEPVDIVSVDGLEIDVWVCEGCRTHDCDMPFGVVVPLSIGLAELR